MQSTEIINLSRTNGLGWGWAFFAKVIFGEYPAIDEVMKQLRSLEDEINGLAP